MTEKQWELLLKVISGNCPKRPPLGFIIDSPWLPGWAGLSTMDYFTSDKLWLEANLKALQAFPEIMFLPGFWSEFGMITEPSAFGAKMVWQKHDFYAEKIFADINGTQGITKPNPATDGMLPFMLKRLEHCQSEINRNGHFIKFAVSRGPLNIASFLLGTTELLIALKLEPEKTRKFIDTISDFIIDWLTVQCESFKTVEGIFLLDDLLGFIGEDDFREFALPVFKKIYSSFNAKVKFLHNDADGLITAKYLNVIGVNLFNFSFKHPVQEIQSLTQNKVALLGNVPPRDVLLNGSPAQIQESVKNLVQSLDSQTRLILSAGGGMPQGVKTENIKAVITALNF